MQIRAIIENECGGQNTGNMWKYASYVLIKQDNALIWMRSGSCGADHKSGIFSQKIAQGCTLYLKKKNSDDWAYEMPFSEGDLDESNAIALNRFLKDIL